VIALVILFAGKEEGKKEEAGPEAEKPAIAKEIYGFSAVIKEINDKTLVLEASIPLAGVEKKVTKKITALVTDNTEIVKWKFPEKLPQEPGQRINAKKTPISFSDLKIGDKIEVAGFGNISENIKNGTKFDLKHIFIVE